MTVTYCTDDDVRRVLQSGAFSTSTTPTKADVEASINTAEREIERRTRHAWREITVTEEFHDIPVFYKRQRRNNGIYLGAGIPIYMKHRAVKGFDTGEGDAVEIWNGSEYEDWLLTKTEGRANDFWLSNKKGILYLRYYWPFFTEQAIRLTYRYGETTVPEDIRDACARLAAIDYLMSDDRSSFLTESGDLTRQSFDDKINKLDRKVTRLLRNYVEPVVIR